MDNAVYQRQRRIPFRPMVMRLFFGLEWLLWVVAFIALFAALFAWLEATAAQQQAIEYIDAQVQGVDRSLWSESRISKYEAAKSGKSHPPVLGVLAIPLLGLEVAVFDGTSARVLNLGVGRVSGTARIGETGNLAIAGHRDGFFRPLKDIKAGDEIALRTADEKLRYRVSEVFVVEPNDISVLSSSDENYLTLITCYPFYFVGSAPQRFIVRAQAVEVD